MSSSYTAAANPYGVKPGGNRYFASSQSLRVRDSGLGSYFRCLKDEVLLDSLSFFSAGDLASMSVTSRAMYVYCHHSDIWRDLVLRKWPTSPVNYIRSWKESYMRTNRNHGPSKANSEGANNKKLSDLESEPLHKPISVDGVFSELLHRAWSCHSCDLATACPGFFQFNDIDRIAASDLTVDDFTARYEVPNKPVVVTKAVEHWKALQQWCPDYLATLEEEPQLFRATSATAPLAANFTLKGYFQYMRQSQEEAPLYLFERDFASKIPALEEDYDVPKYFSDAHNSQETKKTDLFSVIGRDARPDYRWLICGPKKSGSIFHIDPNQTNAWNVSVQGRKKWIFYPPSVSPPGVISSADGADVTVPICIGEWLLSFWDQHLQERLNSERSLRPLEVIVNPGDVIFVPHGYWHMVINVDDCIALTHNYVSTSNLGDCLHFLREKPDQVSGVRDRPGEAIQPEQIYDRFVSALRGHISSNVLQHILEENQQRRGGEGRKSCVPDAVNSRGRRKFLKRRMGLLDPDNDASAPTSKVIKGVTVSGSHTEETVGEHSSGGARGGAHDFAFSFY